MRDPTSETLNPAASPLGTTGVDCRQMTFAWAVMNAVHPAPIGVYLDAYRAQGGTSCLRHLFMPDVAA